MNGQSLNIQLKLVLDNKPQWKCMDDKRDDLRRLQHQLEAATKKFELELKAIQKPVVGDVAGEIE